MIKTGIIGGSRSIAGELIRLLLNHPDVEILWVHSKSNPGKPIVELHPRLIGQTKMIFAGNTPLEDVDILFSCAEPGETEKFLKANNPPQSLRIVDLTDDFRNERPDSNFVYGLPEFNRKRIVRGATRVANPGPIAVAIELALLPAAKNMMLTNTDIIATAFVGSSIAPEIPGRHAAMTDIALCQPTETADSEEITRLLTSFSGNPSADGINLSLTTVRGPFPRGIFATVLFNCDADLHHVVRLYEDYYSDHNFSFVSPSAISLADVLGTNKCLLHLQQSGNKMLVTVAIDDLLKGSAGNAVHNMNLLFGLSEKTGLE